jgi:hypothetical protein
LCVPGRAAAYSVFSHQIVVDAAWEQAIVPLLKQRYPSVSDEQLRRARAFAYGGSLIQDLGYYPFGSRLFSNLTHYVRSGEFVEALIATASSAEELAFATGALAHYVSDNTGHPIAANRAVALMYPELGTEHGPQVLYAHSPARHLMVEFAFDVSQVARGGYAAQAYRDRIGFEVAEQALARAFLQTYGLELDSVFVSRELAIGTYRYAVSRTIPEMTRLAWRENRDEIVARTPAARESDFLFAMSRRDFEQAYGTKYRKPGWFSRFLLVLFKVVPKVGPFRPLAFEPLTPEAERLFATSMAAANEQYGSALRALRSRALRLVDRDLDTGQPPARGVNPLAEETYLALLDYLEDQDFTGMPPALIADIRRHYAARAVPARVDRKARKREDEAGKLLAQMDCALATAPCARTDD